MLHAHTLASFTKPLILSHIFCLSLFTQMSVTAVYAESFERLKYVTCQSLKAKITYQIHNANRNSNNVKIMSLLFVTDYFAPDLCLQHYVAVVSSFPTL